MAKNDYDEPLITCIFIVVSVFEIQYCLPLSKIDYKYFLFSITF